MRMQIEFLRVSATVKDVEALLGLNGDPIKVSNFNKSRLDVNDIADLSGVDKESFKFLSFLNAISDISSFSTDMDAREHLIESVGEAVKFVVYTNHEFEDLYPEVKIIANESTPQTFILRFFSAYNFTESDVKRIKEQLKKEGVAVYKTNEIK